MKKILYKYHGAILKITNCLDKFERINYEALKLIYNGAIEGLAPIEVQIKRSKVVLCAEMTGGVSLRDYFNMNLNGEEVFDCITKILEIAQNCECLGLNPDSFFWNWDGVFVNCEVKSVTMLYWPVFHLESGESKMAEFFREFTGKDAWKMVSQDIAQPYQVYVGQCGTMRIQELYQIASGIREKRRCAYESAELATRNQRERGGLAAHHSGRIERDGFADAWLESVENGAQLPVERGELMIGREHSAILSQSQSKSVSRRHARIGRSNHSTYYVIEDLGSKNGTAVNGTVLYPGQRVRLENGMRIRLGSCYFIFRQ
jgi:hypothetical protein